MVSTPSQHDAASIHFRPLFPLNNLNEKFIRIYNVKNNGIIFFKHIKAYRLRVVFDFVINMSVTSVFLTDSLSFFYCFDYFSECEDKKIQEIY